MKNVSAFVVLFISLFILSCSKKDEIAKPSSSLQEDPKPATIYGSKFDESNSQKVTWDQLPDALKNATPIESLQKDNNLRVAYSYSMGPWGGGGGGAFSIYPYPADGSSIYAIAIRSGSLIDRLTVWYRLSNGTIVVGGDKGGSGGTYYLQFFSSDEYIYYVSGRSGAYLDHLTMYTNKKWFSYGGYGGSPFYASVPAGYQVLGFYGGSGIYIDRIGFYVYTR